MFEWHGYGGGMMWFFWILIIVAVIDEIIERTDTNIGTRFGHNVACLK